MEAELPRHQVMESKRLAHAMLNWVGRNHDDFGILFDLLTIFSSGTGERPKAVFCRGLTMLA